MRCMSVGEDAAVIFKRLEFQRIAAGIEKEKCRLFAGLAFEADIGRDNERNFLLLQFCRKFFPFCHGKDRPKMTHRHIFAVNRIIRFVSGLIRA